MTELERCAELHPTESGPCSSCAGTGWRCDQHQVGACEECRATDGSLTGCPDCTGPAECGGDGRARLRCVRPADGHTRHRGERRARYRATDVLPWGEHDRPAAPPAEPR